MVENVATMDLYDDHVHDDVAAQITHNALRGLNTFIPTPSPSLFEIAVHDYQRLEINSCSMVTSVESTFFFHVMWILMGFLLY